MKRALICGTTMLSASILLPLAAPAQLPPPPTPIIGARSLTLSPDGKLIAFTFQGDIWVGSTSGGVARRVTDNSAQSDYPLFSPDSKYIAFASMRNGGNQIYVANVLGGPTKRLTQFSGSDVPSDWSPDGKQIIFVSRREDFYAGVYSVNVENGMTTRLFRDDLGLASPRFSKDGKSIYYDRVAEFPWFRPRYHGSGAAQFWVWNSETKARTPIEDNLFQHLWPALGFNGQGIMAVTESDLTPSSSPVDHSIGKWTDSAERTPNVYWYSNGSKKRLTNLVGFEGAQFLTSAKDADLIAYENSGHIYEQTSQGPAKQIEFTASEDSKSNMTSTQVLMTGATDAALSPNGETMAFVLNNDIWTVPVKKGEGPNKNDAVQLTNWPGQDSQPVWLPDGNHIAFLSDRNNVLRVFTIDVKTKEVKPVNLDDDDAADIQLIPTKNAISYWVSGENGGLYQQSLAGGTPEKIFSEKNLAGFAGGRRNYAWSPDGRYLAFTKTLQGSGFMPWGDTENVYIKDMVTGTVANVTELSAHQNSPAFSSDGRFLYFVSDRRGPGIYAVSLKMEDARLPDEELKFTAPKGVPTVNIDFEGLSDRIEKLATLPSANADNLQSDPLTGQLYYMSSGQIFAMSYNGKNLTPLPKVGSISAYQPSTDWKSLAAVDDGNLKKFVLPTEPEGGQFAENAVDFRSEFTLNLHAEHVAAFDQFWRAYNQAFYDPNFHGRDWLAIKKHYEPFLASVANRNDISTVLNEMVGELESSHSEVGPAPGNPPMEPDGFPGVLFDYNYHGDGIKVLAVPAKSPASYSKTQIAAGDVIKEINGKPVKLDEDLWSLLKGQAQRNAVFTVFNPETNKTKSVKYRLLTAQEWRSIWSDDQDAQKRAYVESKSNGQLTYVRIPAMDQPSLDKFEQQVFQYSQGKKGIIIDVRGNGGGNTGDAIIDILKRRPHAIYRNRDMSPVMAPGQMLDMPLAVLTGANSFSNAEMYPAAMQDAHLGTLVGTRTPGYVIWTYEWHLVDGTSARLPSSGSYRLDGSPLEDVGVTPDVQVSNNPVDYLKGKDDQLDAAIKVMLAKIKH